MSIRHNHSWILDAIWKKSTVTINKEDDKFVLIVSEYEQMNAPMKEIQIALSPEDFTDLAHFIFDLLYTLTTPEQRGDTE